MQIRIATSADAAPISALIQNLSGPFFLSSDRAGAEPFLDSINEQAILNYVTSNNFSYLIAEDAGVLAGVVAIRDNKHLFHLFVASAYQGTGLGRRLWEVVRSAAIAKGNAGDFTVNSSLNAIAVYSKFGFSPTSEVRQMHGISFQPMAFSGGA
jgi:GNAT superfamily N-acetyltransferase